MQPADSSAVIRERVIAARDRQIHRSAHDGTYSNSLMRPKHIKKYCRLDGAGDNLLGEAVRCLGLSARAYQRILKVARTSADRDHQDDIAPHHLLEATQYRSLDRACSELVLIRKVAPCSVGGASSPDRG